MCESSDILPECCHLHKVKLKSPTNIFGCNETQLIRNNESNSFHTGHKDLPSNRIILTICLDFTAHQ